MELFFREAGTEGKDIIIIHGLYGSSDNWLTIAKKLGESNHVFMVDQRNHGASPNSEIHSYQAMADDIYEFFNTHNLDKAIIIGHSMGGKTAMHFANRYPEKVEKLVVVDIAPKDYYLPENESQFSFHRHILEVLKEIQNNQFSTRKEVLNFLRLNIEGEGLVQFLLKNFARNKETNSFECKLNVDTLYSSLEEIVRGVNFNWFENSLPISGYPVLFLRGENSDYIMDDEIETISRIYPEAQIKTINNAGHWLHAEQPEKFIEELQLFI